MGSVPSSFGGKRQGSDLIDHQIGEAYAAVKIVADNIDAVKTAGEADVDTLSALVSGTKADAQAAAASATSADESEAAALGSKNAAAASATAAHTSELNAAASASAADTAKTTATTKANDAATSATAADTARAAAVTAKTAAETASTAASNSATAANTAKTAAAGSATAANTSATNAAASATAASNSATAAAGSATAAANSAANIGQAETNTAQSATDAAASATLASNKAAAASGSADAAATSATAANASKVAAATSETNAAASASAANTSAGDAAASATAAGTSETNAASSASAAATSATTATDAATAASASATAADASKVSAGTSEVNAAQSAADAAASAQQAADAVNFNPADYVKAVEKGAAGGVATLDGSGTIPAVQLPSFVDDILEFNSLATFPATGVAGKIYVALDTNKPYRWSGSTYIEISPSPGSTDGIAEGTVNKYFTDARAQAALAASLAQKANLASADFTGAITAPTLNGLTVLLRGTSNIGVGLSSIPAGTTGAYNNVFGDLAGHVLTTGSYNNLFGRQAGGSLTTGGGNVVMGYQALLSETTGASNIAIGYTALRSQVGANSNVAVGYSTGYDITSGKQNTLIGWNTGRGITTGQNNTIIGGNVAGLAAGLSGNIILADGAGNIRYQHDGVTATLSGDVSLSGSLINITGNPAADVIIRHSGAAGGALVLENTGGTYGASRLTLKNEQGANGAIFETTDANITLTDFIFKTATGQNNIRYERRAGSVTVGNSWEFQFGINASAAPNTFVIGDAVNASLIAFRVPDDAYAASWNGSVEVPTKNAVYDKMETVVSALNGKVSSTLIGVANGIASLDATGKVPSTQLPSFVDDVLEYASFAALPATGEAGKIYITTDTNPVKQWRWSGSAYQEITSSPGSTDAVPEGSINLYFTNARAAAAAPVQSVAGKTGAVVLAKGDVGLGNVDNTSDANKPVSTAVQTALDGKAPKVPQGQWAASGTLTPTFADDYCIRTGLTSNLLIANPTGTATEEWGISIRLKDNGIARAISWGTQYRPIGVTLPTTTVAGKYLRIGIIYNAADAMWDVVAVAQE